MKKIIKRNMVLVLLIVIGYVGFNVYRNYSAKQNSGDSLNQNPSNDTTDNTKDEVEVNKPVSSGGFQRPTNLSAFLDSRFDDYRISFDEILDFKAEIPKSFTNIRDKTGKTPSSMYTYVKELIPNCAEDYWFKETIPFKTNKSAYYTYSSIGSPSLLNTFAYYDNEKINSKLVFKYEKVYKDSPFQNACYKDFVRNIVFFKKDDNSLNYIADILYKEMKDYGNTFVVCLDDVDTTHLNQTSSDWIYTVDYYHEMKFFKEEGKNSYKLFKSLEEIKISSTTSNIVSISYQPEYDITLLQKDNPKYWMQDEGSARGDDNEWLTHTKKYIGDCQFDLKHDSFQLKQISANTVFLDKEIDIKKSVPQKY